MQRGTYSTNGWIPTQLQRQTEAWLAPDGRQEYLYASFQWKGRAVSQVGVIN